MEKDLEEEDGEDDPPDSSENNAEGKRKKGRDGPNRKRQKW